MSFDPATFLNATHEEANSTEAVPVPEGEYLAIVDKVDAGTWQSKDGSSSGTKVTLTWEIQDDAVKQLLERNKVTVRQDIMLDTTEAGNLDFGKGKNVTLGRVRAATGLNEPGQPFSMAMLQGQLAKVSVKHRIYNDAPQAEVKGVVKAA